MLPFCNYQVPKTNSSEQLKSLIEMARGTGLPTRHPEARVNKEGRSGPSAQSQAHPASAVRPLLAREVLGVKLEELAFLRGLKAILFQVLRVESPGLKVLLDGRRRRF